MQRAVVLVALLAGTAHAGPTLPGGATISFGALELPSGATTPPAHYFNFAHCACSQPGAAGADYIEGTFAYQLRLAAGTMPVHRPLEIWVGTGCDDAATRASSCHQIASATIPDLSTIPAAGVTPAVPVFDLMEPEPSAETCEFRALANGEWAMADADGDGTLDYFVGQPIATDAQAPPLPANFSAEPGPGSIDLAWTPPADLSNLATYQALCATVGGSPASTKPPPAAAYVTARNLCGEAQDVPLVPSPLEPGAPGLTPSQGLAELDPAFVCGQQLDPTATSMHLADLDGTGPFVVVVLAIDAAGNPAATYLYPAISAGAPAQPGCGCTASEPRATLGPLVMVALGLAAPLRARLRRFLALALLLHERVRRARVLDRLLHALQAVVLRLAAVLDE
jgi:hypothetical protein